MIDEGSSDVLETIRKLDKIPSGTSGLAIEGVKELLERIETAESRIFELEAYRRSGIR